MFKAGDKIQGRSQIHPSEVLAVGNTSYYVRFHDGRESCLSHAGGHANYFLVPNVQVRYFNVYDGNVWGYKTRKDADAASSDRSRISCIRVEFPAGRFDD